MRRSPNLRVDPIACTGHGICGELLPELIRFDDWGYPIIDGEAIRPSMMPDVRRAIAACPALALRLEGPSPAKTGRSRRSAALR